MISKKAIPPLWKSAGRSFRALIFMNFCGLKAHLNIIIGIGQNPLRGFDHGGFDKFAIQ